jgi:hypothetical protein
MSIASLLLGLPGAVKRLRGHNAPKAPLPLNNEVSSVVGDTYASYLVASHAHWKPTIFTHGVEHRALNNSAQVSTEVANLSGRGAFDAVWLLTRLTTANNKISYTYSYRVEILVDGVDVAPLLYAHTDTWQRGGYAGVSAAVGGARIWSNANPASDAGGYEPHWERFSVPIPFRNSLVVNLIHETTNSVDLYTRCWVNAWLTE